VNINPYLKPRALALAVTSIAIPTHAFGTLNFGSCGRSDEYTQRTHELIQDAQKGPFELLIVMNLGQPQEIAIGLVRKKDEYHLVRSEFHPSPFYGSHEQLGPREEIADLTKTHVHVDKWSIPISSGLARTMASKLNRLEARKEPNRIILEDGTWLEEIKMDGYVDELTLTDGRCVAVHSPPQDTSAFNFVTFNRFLASELGSWRPRTRVAFEAQAMLLLNDIDPNE
jgi:hypothetical protein